MEKDFWFASKRFWKSARQVSKALTRLFLELFGVNKITL